MDLGCGEGELAERLAVDDTLTKFRHFSTVHSYDLVALKKHITVCDIAKLTLGDSTVGCAVFCLSLMGSNYWQFVAEAVRVLKVGGILVISEVASRISDQKAFVDVILKAGFRILSRQEIEGYFNMFVFEKSQGDRHLNFKGKEELLKPCLYKKR